MDDKQKVTILLSILGILLIGIGVEIIFMNGGFTKTDNNESNNVVDKDTKQDENKDINKDEDENKVKEEIKVERNITSLEDAIKFSLIDYIGKDEGNSEEGRFGFAVTYYEDSIWTEGHKTLKTEIKDDKIYAYVLAIVETYSKKNDKYEVVGGTAAPILIIFTKDYKYIEYYMPEDGMGYYDSVKALYPDDIEKEALHVDFSSDFYKNQINSYLK